MSHQVLYFEIRIIPELFSSPCPHAKINCLVVVDKTILQFY